MSAYYNESDRFAAAWLRELIKERLIANGEVDERDIREVQPADLRGFTQHHFFAGIGVWSYALRKAGWPDDLAVWTGSCPCQSFSASGKREGFSDQRHLWPAWFRLIRESRPEHIFGEQVSGKDGLAWFDIVSSDLEGAAYTIGALDTSAAGVGAPHIRQRLYFVAHSGQQRRQQIGGRPSQNEGTDGRRQEGGAGQLADTELRRPKQRNQVERGISKPDASSELGDTNRSRPQGSELRTACDRDGNRTEAHGTVGQSGERLDESEDRGRRELRNSREENGRPAQPIETFWSNIRWHYCRDGRYRPVPPQSEIFPLAARSSGRVGTLRGAGNALCAPQAEEFIRAYISVIENR